MVDRVVELVGQTSDLHGERWLRDVYGAGTMAAEALAQAGRAADARDALLRSRQLRRRLAEPTDARYSRVPLPSGRAPVVHLVASGAAEERARRARSDRRAVARPVRAGGSHL